MPVPFAISQLDDAMGWLFQATESAPCLSLMYKVLSELYLVSAHWRAALRARLLLRKVCHLHLVDVTQAQLKP